MIKILSQLLTKKEVLYLSLYLLGWRLVLFLVSALAGLLLPYQPSFPYADAYLATSHLPQWLYSWANFDGVHYLTIAQNGYLSVNYIQAFFPVFPSLMAVLMQVIPSAIISGLLISHFFTWTAILLWFGLLRSSYNSKVAWAGTLILTLFPAAFFFVALYGESLFLTLVLLAMIMAKNQKWGTAGIVIAIASATRIVGIFLVPAIMIELILQQIQAHPKLKLSQIIKKNIFPLFQVMLGSVGLGLYMLFLQQNFHDPLYFAHVQSEFGAGREEKIILFPQVIWRYVKIFVTYLPIDLKYFVFIQEFVTSTVGLLLLFLSFKKVRLSYLFFALPAFLLPTLTGTFSSMLRYCLICFPIFMFLAICYSTRRRVMIVYCLISALLLIINTILFIQGYWVA